MGLGRYPWTSTAQREHREGGRLEPALLLEPHQSSTKGEACEEKALGKAPGLVRHVGTMAAQQGLPPSHLGRELWREGTWGGRRESTTGVP